MVVAARSVVQQVWAEPAVVERGLLITLLGRQVQRTPVGAVEVAVTLQALEPLAEQVAQVSLLFAQSLQAQQQA